MFMIVSCPHFSSSSLAAQSGQLLAAILSKIMFLVKQPSVVCRVLNSDLCPPHNLLHDIESYPILYEGTRALWIHTSVTDV